MADGVLIGRKDELDLARDLLRRAADGSPGVLLVGGEAGIGRTRLVSAVMDDARAAGFRVAHGTCVRMDAGALTYAAIVDGLHRLVAELDPAEVASTLGMHRHQVARLLPEVVRAPVPDPAPGTTGVGVAGVTGVGGAVASSEDPLARLRLFEALVAWLNRLAERGPLLLVVEDLQWADAATLDLVRALAVGLAGRAALAVTTRTDEMLAPAIQATVAELVRDGAERVELAPFDARELAAFAAAVRLPGSPEPDEAALATLRDRTGGNPFLVIELIDAGLLEPGASDRVVPRSLRDILDARIGALEPTVIDLLRAAALHPGAIDDGVLAAVAGVPIRTVGAALREAQDAGVLASDGGGPAFRHALQREVLVERLGPGERRALHAAYADALTGARDPAVATAVAWHRDAAGDDARTLAAHLDALGIATAAAAFDAAWRHAERAAELRAGLEPGGAGPDAVDLLHVASLAAILEGDPSRSAAFARRALEALAAAHETGARAATLHDRLRWALWEGGDRAGAAMEVERAAAALDETTPLAVRALVTAQRAATRMDDADPGPALALADDAIRMAAAAGTRDAEAIALGVRGRVLAAHGQVDEGVASLREAIAIADEVGSLQGHAVGVAMITTILARWGRAREALADIDAAVEAADAAGLSRSLGAQLLAQAARACLAIGDWDAAAARVASGLARRPAAPIEAGLRIVALRLAAGRGQAIEAETQERRLGALASSIGDPEDVAGVRVARAEAALARGDAAAVRPLLDEQLVALDAGLEPGPSAAWLAGLASWAEADLLLDARARGDVDGTAAAGFRLALITAVVREQAGGARARWGPLAAAIVAHVEAEATRVADDNAARVDAWTLAADGWTAIDRPAYAAWARYRLAEARLANGEPRPVIADELTLAADTARRLGAVSLLARIDRLARLARVDLRATGGSGGALPAGTDAGGGSDPLGTLGLTPREREILRLVAAGWSNGRIADHLVISISTASVHVSNILAKLDVENRVEAAALAHRLGVVGVALAP